MAMAHKENKSNDDAWDNLCLNPHQQTQEDGRERGRHDGSISGYNEGYNIGRTTAMSNGMEIGFIQGVLAYLTTEYNLSAMLKDDEKLERAQRSIQSLQIAINGFPSADALIQRTLTDPTTQDGGIPSDNDDDNINNGNSIDISNKLQLIRARFKLLMVQLGLPHVSLKQLMDTNVNALVNSDNNVSTDENLGEW
jgi:hypothetical protein